MFRHDAWWQVGLDAVVEPILAVLFGFPDLDDAPPASRTGPASMADETFGSSYARCHLACYPRVNLLGQVRFSDQQHWHCLSPSVLETVTWLVINDAERFPGGYGMATKAFGQPATAQAVTTIRGGA
jgi:hypothetical protein